MEARLTDNLLPLKVPVLEITHKVLPSPPKTPPLNTQQLLLKIYSTINSPDNSKLIQPRKSSSNNE